MSVTLATVADALIEFILSLLRDPEAAAEFDADPEAALAARGFNNVTAADVCAVAPVVVDRANVVPSPAPKPAPPHPEPNPVVREIKNVTNNFTHVDDRDTIVDQSVNQNIWTEGGDVTQVFDNEAIVASGDNSIAAGNNVGIENNLDRSTNIDADNSNINIGSDVDTTNTTDSNNTTTDTTTNNDIDTTVDVDGSFNDTSSETTNTGSYNDVTVQDTDTTVNADVDVIYQSDDAVIADVSSDEI